jgi:hypothetical protein
MGNHERKAYDQSGFCTVMEKISIKYLWGFTVKSATRLLMVIVVLTALGAAQTVGAGERSSTANKSDPSSSQCQGVTQTRGENIENKADLERAIAKQLKEPSVTLLYAYACGNWTVLLVNTRVPSDSYVHLFYSGNPLTNRYIAELEGSDFGGEEPKIKDLVLKTAPGIPPKLASCFARHFAD